MLPISIQCPRLCCRRLKKQLSSSHRQPILVKRLGSRNVLISRLKKAQLYAKARDADKAAAEFDALIGRNPDEPRFYTTAAEEMLRLKQGAKALSFADRGLEKARATGNRDLEGHCQELAAAARRAL